jgi:hypothetical protein
MRFRQKHEFPLLPETAIASVAPLPRFRQNKEIDISPETS